jgi:hypothetical protein
MRSWAAGLLIGLLACGGDSSSVPDTVGFDAVDPGTDLAAPDIADLGPGLDVPAADPGPPDVPAVEIPADSGTPDVDWPSLPRLPKSMTFTTRYAAGVAREVINPPKPTYLGGFGFCGGAPQACRMSESVHDDISATAVALADTKTGEVVILVGIDAAGVMRADAIVVHAAIQKALYDKHGVFFEGNRLVFGASHAHSAPDLSGMFGPMDGSGRDAEYAAFLQERVVAAGVEAFGRLADANLDWALVPYAANSDDDPGADDKDLLVLRGRKPGGDTVFTLARWSSHPTTYGSGNNAISGDFPGTFRREMELRFGGLAVFLNGSVGSVYPDRPACGAPDLFPNGWMDPDVSPEDHSKVACCGRNLADAAEAALKDAKPLAETGIVNRFKDFEFHPTNLLMMTLAELAPLPIESVDINDPESRIPSSMSWVSVGDLDFVTAPGEAFPSVTAHVREILIGAGFAHPVLIGLGHDWMGYLLTPDQWKDKNLEYHQNLSPSSVFEPAYLDTLKSMLPK